MKRPPPSLQARALGVGRVLKAGAPAGIAFACQQDVGEALWLTKGVATLQQAHGGSCAKSVAAVDVPMFEGDDMRQFAAFIGNAQAPAQGQNKGGA